MNTPAKKADEAAASIEAVLIKGDLSKLTEKQRLEYINSVCKLVGLNPLTRPFDYLFLNGKLVLYPNKSCAEQLRKIHGISLEIVSQDLNADGLYTVHARAKDDTGRTDEDVGVVTLGQLRGGEAVANTILKCVTKAKRRVTLSICGLGFLDSEGDDAPRVPERRQPTRLYPADHNTPDTPLTTTDEPDDVIDQKHLNILIAECDELGTDKRKLCKDFGVPSMADLTPDQFAEAMAQLARQRKAIEDGDAQGEALL